MLSFRRATEGVVIDSVVASWKLLESVMCSFDPPPAVGNDQGDGGSQFRESGPRSVAKRYWYPRA